MFEMMMNNDIVKDDTATGDLVSKFVKLPDTVLHIIEKMQIVMIPNIVTVIVASIYIGYKADVVLGALLAFLAMIITVIVFVTPSYCKVTSVKAEELLTDIYDEVDDVFRNMISIHERDQSKQEIHRMCDKEDTLAIVAGVPYKCSLKIKGIMLPFIFVLLVAFGYRSYYGFINKKISISTFVVVFIIIMEVLSSLLAITDQMKDLTFYWGTLLASNKLFETVDMPHATKDQTTIDRKRIPDFKKCIEIKNLWFRYPDTKTSIIQDLNLKICPGCHIAIIGKIGCGKSTLLKLIMKFLKPDKGNIYWDNIPIEDIPSNLLRKNIGMIPQTPVLFNRSIFDNITYGRPDVTKEKVEQMMKDFGIESLINSHSDGINFVVGKSGSRLSGGQRQMVWCMRVLLGNPQILLMDEPTSAVDIKSQKILTNLLAKAMKGRACIMVTHDQNLMKHADKIINICEKNH
jgi:ABC-type multidrug transport system fused ATPase/permease subunit